jgi:hypothetical protein
MGRVVWIEGNGRGAVEIKGCGANLCGHIVWAHDEADSSKGCGKQIIDLPRAARRADHALAY